MKIAAPFAFVPGLGAAAPYVYLYSMNLDQYSQIAVIQNGKMYDMRPIKNRSNPRQLSVVEP